jgi:hypothetical protein
MALLVGIHNGLIKLGAWNRREAMRGQQMEEKGSIAVVEYVVAFLNNLQPIASASAKRFKRPSEEIAIANDKHLPNPLRLQDRSHRSRNQRFTPERQVWFANNPPIDLERPGPAGAGQDNRIHLRCYYRLCARLWHAVPSKAALTTTLESRSVPNNRSDSKACFGTFFMIDQSNLLKSNLRMRENFMVHMSQNNPNKNPEKYFPNVPK